MKNGHFVSLFLLVLGSAICIVFKEIFGEVYPIVWVVAGGIMIGGTIIGVVMLYEIPKNGTMKDKLVS